MHSPFHELRERLLTAGIAPRHIRRYLRELSDHFADLIAEELSIGRNQADARVAALDRLGNVDDLANAMVQQSRFRSWSARAPWAVFGIMPTLLLAGIWFLSLFILWSGWKIFLPTSDTPFVRIHGLAVLYFNFGRLLYYGAPFLIGWSIGWIAARQRINALWTAVGLLPIAWMAAIVKVRAGRAACPNCFANISLSLNPGSTTEAVISRLLVALVVLAVASLPYVLMRFRQSRSVAE